MTDVGSVLHSPIGQQPASTVTRQLRNIKQRGAQLLELRTEAGIVYVRPSAWQRIRLQWAFRHFRVLPPQVLGRSNRRLIEKLSRSAVVTPARPVASNTVFGVVETVRSTCSASANRGTAPGIEPAATQPFLAKPKIPELLSPNLAEGVKPRETRDAPGGPKTEGPREARFPQWAALGTTAAVCVAVILVSVYGTPLFSSTGQMSNALWNPRMLPTPRQPTASGIKPPPLHGAATSPPLASPATTSRLNAEKLRRWIAPPPLEPMLPGHEPAALASDTGQPIGARSDDRSAVTTLDPVPDTLPGPAPTVPAATSERRFVLELPQGHFAYPVVAETNLVGDLQLKALIAADGSVKEVTVLSGSPKLAEAGMRAVRQWHYSPYRVLGSPVEVETQIKMSFFGQDAISIASVAGGPSSQAK